RVVVALAIAVADAGAGDSKDPVGAGERVEAVVLVRSVGAVDLTVADELRLERHRVAVAREEVAVAVALVGAIRAVVRAVAEEARVHEAALVVALPVVEAVVLV